MHDCKSPPFVYMYTFLDGEPVCCGAFGNGLGIVTDSFNCTGSELNLLGCTRSQSCDNASIEAVGVVCTS